MPKRKLRDDVDGHGHADAWLEDDYGTRVVVDVLPRLTLLTRSESDIDENGDPEYEWATLIDDQPVTAYSRRTAVRDGVERETVKVTALDPGSPVDATCVIQLSWGKSDDPSELTYFRVTSAVSNGLRLDVEAERVV